MQRFLRPIEILPYHAILSSEPVQQYSRKLFTQYPFTLVNVFPCEQQMPEELSFT